MGGEWALTIAKGKAYNLLLYAMRRTGKEKRDAEALATQQGYIERQRDIRSTGTQNSKEEKGSCYTLILCSLGWAQEEKKNTGTYNSKEMKSMVLLTGRLRCARDGCSEGCRGRDMGS